MSEKTSFMNRWKDVGALVSQPFERAVVHVECCFLFISISYSEEVVSMSKINLRINASPAGSIKEIRDERKWVVVFLHDAV